MTVRRFLVIVWAWLRDWPERFVYAMALIVTGAHEPVMVPADDLAQWPNGEMPWCLRDGVPWPCDAFVAASERQAGRSS